MGKRAVPDPSGKKPDAGRARKQIADRADRISYYESLLQKLQSIVSGDAAASETLFAAREIADALGAYYGSDDWKQDFAADEAGMLPHDLRRGVLSEDGIYNALEAYGEWIREPSCKGEVKMRKVLFINGSPNENGCTAAAMDEMIRELNENGVETELLWLGKKAVPDCMACYQCISAGKCVFNDEVNAIGGRMDEFDGIVVGSPVYYGGPNGRLTSFLDRLFFSVPGDRFEGKLAASIVSCRRGGASAAFERLNQYFLMSNMHVVGSQYWNQIHGSSAEEAKQDAEGLQTMRTLAKNMAWLLKVMEAGEQAGLERPALEEKTLTNFIR